MTLTRYITLAAVLVAIACTTSCDNAPPSASINVPAHSLRALSTLNVRCKLLALDADYFDGYSYSLPERCNFDQYVLTDIETFFLFQSKNQTKPRWNSIPPETTNSIHDNVAKRGEKYAVNVSWSGNNDLVENELTIGTADSSLFCLRSTTTVTIPMGGSVILRTDTPATDGKTEFLWLITGGLIGKRQVSIGK